MPVSGVRRRVSVQRLPIEVIVEPSWLPKREDLGDIVSLARTIKMKGDVDVPIKVRRLGERRYEMVWGKRRLEAAKLAGLVSITCMIEDMVSDEELLRQHCIENIQRVDRNPIEEAELFAFWKNKFNKSYEEIARILGISPDYIYNRVELLRLNPQVKAKLKTIRSATKKAENIGLYHARLLLKVRDVDAQLRLLDELINNRLSTRELDKIIKEMEEERDHPITRKEKTHQAYRRQGRRTFMDLTHPIYLEGQGNLFPGFVKLGYDTYGWEICRKIRITHRDTHIDCPRLMYEDGKAIGEYPLNKFINEGVIINLAKNKLEAIHTSDVEKNASQIKDGDIVILNTGWWRYHDSERYIDHPFITEEVADWLIKKKVKALCIDTPTPDMPLSIRREVSDRPVHSTLLSKDILIVENICNCSIDSSSRRVNVMIVPMFLGEAGEVPVRVIASF